MHVIRDSIGCALVAGVFIASPASALAQGYNAFTDPNSPLMQRMRAQGLQALGVSPGAVNTDQQRQAEETARLRLENRLEGASRMLEIVNRQKEQARSLIIQDLLAGRALQAYLDVLFHPITVTAPLLGGATFNVPFGSYSGDALLRTQATMVPSFQGGYGWQDQIGLYQQGHGWRFEPAGVLLGAVNVAQVGETPNEPLCFPALGQVCPDGNRPQNTRPCLFYTSYRYAGPGGTYTFVEDKNERTFTLDPALYPVKDHPAQAGACLMRLTLDRDGAFDDTYLKSKIGTKFRSTTGDVTLDLSNRAAPVIRFPDGTVETMGTGPQSAGFVQDTQYESFLRRPSPKSLIPSLPVGMSILDASMRLLDTTYTATRHDRNGQVTRFTSTLESRTYRLTLPDKDGVPRDYDFPYTMGRETAVEDPEGRVTRFTRDDDGEVVEIRGPGPLGVEHVWTLKWSSFEWDPGQVMPDVKCFPYSHANSGPPRYAPLRLPGQTDEACPKLSYRTLTEMALPDGTKYTFKYELPNGEKSWGALTEVRTPGGAVYTFKYGDQNTVTHWPLPTTSSLGRIGNFPLNATPLMNRWLVEAAVYPLGTGAPGHLRKTRHEFVTKEYASPIRNQMIDYPTWVVTDYFEVNGSTERLERTMRETRNLALAGPEAMSIHGDGRVLAIEMQTPQGDLVEGTYFGRSELTRDHALVEAQGGDYFSTKRGVSILLNLELDGATVPTRTVHFRDGVWWLETFEHDAYNNQTKKTIVDAANNRWRETVTRYKHESDARYIERNLLRLPTESTVSGFNGKGKWDLLLRRTMDYDTVDPLRSNDDGVDRAWAGVKERGNMTVERLHRVAASDGNADPGVPPAMVTTRRFYDNGATAEVVTPGDRITTLTNDFRKCSPTDVIRESTVTSPDPRNGTGRQTVTMRRECYSELPLSVIDANGNRACTQYDALGREIETAIPGDQLSSLANGVRDPDCVPTGVASLGSNGAGPTTWRRYMHLGKIGQTVGGADPVHQYEQVWTKNGTTDGHYAKTFADGLGRSIQVCNQADSTSHAGNVEICVTKDYDESGRTDSETLPFYVASPAETVTAVPARTQRTVTTLDVLGRPTRIELENSGVKPIEMTYGAEGGAWVRATIDANGNRSETYVNLLGDTIVSRRASLLCEGNWCTTLVVPDGLGRVVSVTGPKNADGTGGHTMTAVINGLGRPKETTDPSLGKRTMTYHTATMELETVTDARNNVTRFKYDGLGRVESKTFKPAAGTADRSEELVTRYTYDGVEGAGTENAKGKPSAVANGLVKRQFAYDLLGREIEARITIDGTTFSERSIYGYPVDRVRPGRGARNVGAGALVRQRVLANGEVVSYTYDADGQLAGIFAGGEPIVSGVQRNVHGDILEVRMGNNARTRYAYDENRSWRLREKRVTGTADEVLLDMAFQWDDAGNLKRLDNRRNPERSWEFEYDVLNQMQWAEPGKDRERRLTYRYNGIGNLLGKQHLVRDGDGWRASDAIEQSYGGSGAGPFAITSAGTDTFSYDAAGNVVSTTASGNLTFEWNSENMPVYTRRGGRIVAEKWFLGESMWKRRSVDPDTEATTITLYPFAGTEVEGGKFRIRYADWAERDTDGQLRYFHRDQLGSSTVVTDQAGNLAYEAAYQPWGEDWTEAKASAYEPKRRFSDKEHERVSGVYDFGARLYMPSVGRWMSADTILDGLNRYTYVDNNPASRVDPDGHKTCLLLNGKTLQCSETSEVTFEGAVWFKTSSGGPLTVRDPKDPEFRTWTIPADTGFALVDPDREAARKAAEQNALESRIRMGSLNRLMRRTANTYIAAATFVAVEVGAAKTAYKYLPKEARDAVRTVFKTNTKFKTALKNVGGGIGGALSFDKTYEGVAGGIGVILGYGEAMEETLMPNFKQGAKILKAEGFTKKAFNLWFNYELSPKRWDDVKGEELDWKKGTWKKPDKY